ncbi:MAG: CPBP family intramembrane metalloprotease [Ignavibacteria bacterium]|nr:CPBP family intramembrane metalloprotease [Ignavibacteria bacterium]
MIKYLSKEIKSLFVEIKSLDFKTVYIFISVSVVIFLSVSYTNPSFYLRHLGKSFLNAYLYWFLADGLLMFLIPVLSIKFVFKKNLKDFGFRFGDVKFGLITLAVFFIVMLIVVWIVSASEQFAKTYPQGGQELRNSVRMFIIFEFCVLIYMLGWEFIWRGYMLFGLKEKFGYYAIFIQMLPFFILHRGKPELELFASIFAGIILGIQAWRSNSFIYCWILHWLVVFSIDIISLLRYQNNFYKILF